MSEEIICPCDTFVHPLVIFNPPGRQSIDYRAGDFLTFRHALLLPRVGETELVAWHPGAEGDLAVQMIEWWAYLADVLTFYTERIANESYLRTAQLPETVNRLIRLLGYRPRPGIGATAVLAAIAGSARPFTLAQGFQIQSKSGPGKQPQIFELDANTVITPPGPVDVDPPAGTTLSIPGDGQSTHLLLKGAVTAPQVGDEFLLLKNKPSPWDGTTSAVFALLRVQEPVTLVKDPRGATNSRLTVMVKRSNIPGSAPNNVPISDYQLLKSAQPAVPWPYIVVPDNDSLNNLVITGSQVHLSQITRQIKAGDLALFQAPAGVPESEAVCVSGYSEVVWYANASSGKTPETAPPNPPTIPIPIPHSVVTFQPPLHGQWASNRAKAQVRYGWQPVGELAASPVLSADSTLTQLAAAGPDSFPGAISIGRSVPFLLEDANGAGALGSGSLNAATGPLQVIRLSQLPDPPTILAPPLRTHFNTLHVSRGKTVARETLGSGDASQASQEFVLQNAPLTYLANTDITSGEQYRSTLRIWVDSIEWQEALSFYAQERTAHVFVTREDEQAKTHVQFGDGVNGARLPTGVNNVVASYRYGSGADAPAAGSLTVIVQPQPNLKAIRNPVPAGGGDDPDPPAQIKRYAPRSVLTFGRAISGDDYETIAAQAPGVARAKVYWTWDHDEQRTQVVVYVGDTAAAVASARSALAADADPNRPLRVKPAQALRTQLTLAVRLDPAYLPDPVEVGVRAALLDPDNGLFGVNMLGIGQSVYDSQIDAACLAVPGALALHGLTFAFDHGTGTIQTDSAPRHDPGEGGFFQLLESDLNLSVEGPNHAG